MPIGRGRRRGEFSLNKCLAKSHRAQRSRPPPGVVICTDLSKASELNLWTYQGKPNISNEQLVLLVLQLINNNMSVQKRDIRDELVGQVGNSKNHKAKNTETDNWVGGYFFFISCRPHRSVSVERRRTVSTEQRVLASGQKCTKGRTTVWCS